jgi:hypothetical protein
MLCPIAGGSRSLLPPQPFPDGQRLGMDDPPHRRCRPRCGSTSRRRTRYDTVVPEERCLRKVDTRRRRCVLLPGRRRAGDPGASTQANAYAERWERTVRAECLEWLLVVGRAHLEQVLRVYVEHDNRHRPHRALMLHSPDWPPGGPCLAMINETVRVDATSSAVCSRVPAGCMSDFAHHMQRTRPPCCGQPSSASRPEDGYLPGPAWPSVR